MHFGYNYPHADYDMQGIYLESVFEEKDLGVTMSNDLKWENSVVRLRRKQTKQVRLIAVTVCGPANVNKTKDTTRPQG